MHKTGEHRSKCLAVGLIFPHHFFLICNSQESILEECLAQK